MKNQKKNPKTNKQQQYQQQHQQNNNEKHQLNRKEFFSVQGLVSSITLPEIMPGAATVA